VSAAAPALRSKPLTVLLDLRHPFAYLALSPAAALRRELGVEVDFVPHRTPPLRPPAPPGPEDERGVRHRRARARAIAREIGTYAAVQGLELREWYRDPDPGAFELAWLWLRAHDPGRLEAFLREGFAVYWALELDPGDADEVAAVAGGVGADVAALRAWAASDGPPAAAALTDALRELGVPGVPGYLVEDEVFQGRQHLPMIRWILGGRRGPGPI